MSILENLFGRRPQVAPAQPPQDVRPSTPDPPAARAPPVPARSAATHRDAFDVSVVGEHERRAVTCAAEIRYVDTRGLETLRRFKVDYWAVGQEDAVHGFCELRQANRTLLLRGITQWVDQQTGEIVGDVGTHLERLWRPTLDGQADALLARLGHYVTASMFALRIAGRVSPARKRALLDTALQIGENFHTSPDALWARIKSDSLTRSEFDAAVSAMLEEDEASRERFSAGLRALASAGKARDPLLEAAVDLATRALSRRVLQERT